MVNTDDQRRKVSPSDWEEIHRRYFDRLRSGETVRGIAEEFGVTRQHVLRIVRRYEEQKSPGA